MNQVTSYSQTITTNGDPTDIYYPNPSSRDPSSSTFPIALLLQGFDVDKSYYSQFASLVASYGFVVVVPNHTPYNRTFLAPELRQIVDVLDYMKTENINPNSPVAGTLNTEKLVLLGHSCGGITGLEAIRDKSDISWSRSEDYSRPKELVAGVFYGTNLRGGKDGYININNTGIPIALIAGSLDSIVLPEFTKQTYENIQKPPKALITVTGANHYGITNVSQPADGPLEINKSTLAQNLAVETIAHWSALFLRAYTLDDKASLDYLDINRDVGEQNVSVIIEK